ncbi:nucleoside transporter [Pseudohyphozyma bogoriensis]|nr:nucleoside transporter [Pseudohyphozyma bogoriensis]
MLAPLTHGAKAKLEAAERLVNESRRSRSTSRRNSHEAPTPEQLEPEEAAETVEQEYEPLMGSGDGRWRHESSADEDEAGEEQEQVQVRKLEVHVSYAIFFILGACILLPWNSELVAGTYFSARLEGSPLQQSWTNWLALTFTACNLLFLALANASQQGANLSHRIFWSITTMTTVLVVGIISTAISEINQTLFFVFLILCTVFLSASASYLQNAVVALSSRFGAHYLQGILSGQGAIGLSVALLQFISAYASTSLPSRITPLAVPSSVRASAFSFFLTITIFSFLSLLSYLVLTRLPLYRLVIRSAETSSRPHSPSKRKPSLRAVEHKVRILGCSIFYCFFVTLAVFPSTTSSVASVHEGTGKGGRLAERTLFVPLGFIVFNAGDWIGRAMPGWKRIVFSDWRWLAGCSAARSVFIPLFLLCNVQASSSDSGLKSPIFNSDFVFMLLMLLFSITNGYISTLIMLAGLIEPSLEEDEVDIAATCLAFYLTSGLAAGSLVSFAVKAAVCHCNPFS